MGCNNHVSSTDQPSDKLSRKPKLYPVKERVKIPQ